MAFTRNQIKKAGKVLRDKELFSAEEVSGAEDALTYWRTIHGKVMNEFYKIVYDNTIRINKNAFVAQRLKRAPSIIAKLKRINNMQLSTMQDIAGIRAVVDNLTELRKLEKELKNTITSHVLKNEDDYLVTPKESGYRSIHLIYKYNDPTKSDSDRLLFEIQIRTKLQHAWATAVETMGTFLGTQLKFDEGQPKWLKYFALTSSAFSFLEKTNPVPNYSKMSEYETYQQAVYEFNYNKIESSLRVYSLAANMICEDDDESKRFHLIVLNINEKKGYISSYRDDQFERANREYTELERKSAAGEPLQVVLVSTESIRELRDAFPNYFLDTREFLKNMEIIKKKFEQLKKSTIYNT